MEKNSIFNQISRIWDITSISEISDYQSDRSYDTLNPKRAKIKKMIVCEAINNDYSYSAFLDFRKFILNQTSIMIQYKFDGEKIHLRFISEDENILKTFKEEVEKYIKERNTVETA